MVFFFFLVFLKKRSGGVLYVLVFSWNGFGRVFVSISVLFEGGLFWKVFYLKRLLEFFFWNVVSNVLV